LRQFQHAPERTDHVEPLVGAAIAAGSRYHRCCVSAGTAR
jgi:hypothetical protein